MRGAARGCVTSARSVPGSRTGRDQPGPLAGAIRGRGCPRERDNYPGRGREASGSAAAPACTVRALPIRICSHPARGSRVPFSAAAAVETVCFEFQNASIFVLRKYDPIDNYFTAEGWLSRHGTFPFIKPMSILSKPPEIIITTLPPSPFFFLHINLLSFLLILECSPTCPQFNP